MTGEPSLRVRYCGAPGAQGDPVDVVASNAALDDDEMRFAEAHAFERSHAALSGGSQLITKWFT